MLKVILWIIGIILGMMGYLSIASLTFDNLAGEEYALYQECEAKKAGYCHFNYGTDAERAIAVTWPVSIPVMFVWNNPILFIKGVLLIVALVVVVLGGAAGVLRWRYVRYKRQQKKKADMARNLQAAEALIRREAPELLAATELE